MASYRIDFKPSVKRDLKSIPRREALTILDAISNLSDNPIAPQSMTLNGCEGWRLRLCSCRVISAASSREITLFIEKALYRKTSANDFLQNEANFVLKNRCMIKPVISC